VPGARVAVGEHVRGGVETQRLGQAAAEAHEEHAVHSAARPRPASERRLVDRLKGDFAIGRTRCYPLTITDSYSRFIIAIVALTSTKTNVVKRALQRVFDEYGLPEAIRSDNGSPFSSRGVAGLSTLSVWWHKLGIRHERIDPGHPEQNGRHERMHRDLKRETASPPATTVPKQQRLFDQFRARFNQERPHEALDQRTPHEFYEISSRRLPVPWWGKDFEYDQEAEALRVSQRRLHRYASWSLLLEYDADPRAH
jgi:transposase InsO family protein